ncbi:MAG: leucine-rich repeat domain-containing protein [Chitinophagales bacterium]
MSDANNQQHCRYPGAVPFTVQQSNIFFGRDSDTERLYKLITRNSLVVLYGKSGLGKSSLINAGIIPLIKNDQIYAPITIRFRAWQESEEDTPLAITKTYLKENNSPTFLSALIKNDDTLWLHAKNKQLNSNLRPLLILDQFEELFTYPTEQVNTFMQEMSELLHTDIPLRFIRALDQSDDKVTDEQEDQLEEELNARIVFAIRSDKLHLINRLTAYLPDIMRNMHELKALSIEDAKSAIKRPAEMQGNFISPPFDYSDAALQKILDFLVDDKTQSVEGIMIQMLCEYYEREKIVKQGVTLLDLPQIGDPSEVVKNYYQEKIETLDASDQMTACKLIEEGLVSDGDAMRLSLHEAFILQEFGVDIPLLRELVDKRLLRSEPFARGGYTYELSHDRLIAPVIEARNKRRQEEYEKEKLIEAERLKAQAERERLEKIKAKKQLRTARFRLMWSIITLALSLGLGIIAYISFQNAKSNRIAWEKEAIKAQLAKSAAEKSDSLSKVALIEMERQRNIADSALIEAEREKENAEQARIRAETAALIAENARKSADSATIVALFQKENADIAANEAKKARIRADSLLDVAIESENRAIRSAQAADSAKIAAINNLEIANALLDAVFFYNDRFALASIKDSELLHFIDREGKHIDKFGEWDKATQFRNNGLANVSKNGQEFKMDTLGNQYLVAPSIDDLTSNKHADNYQAIEQNVTKLNDVNKVFKDSTLKVIILTGINFKNGELKEIQSKNLEVLYLKNLNLKQIPSSVLQMKQLRFLDMRDNELLVLPDAIDEMVSLEKMYFLRTGLTQIPGTIGRMKKLSVAYFDQNMITALPPEIGRLKNLTYLSFSHNQISTLPKEIGQLDQLQTLFLDDNKLTDLPPQLYDLPSLTKLVLNDNQINSIPHDIGKLKHLEILDLRNNKLTKLPESIKELKNLKELVLTGNMIPNEEREKIMEWLPHCKKIKFSDTDAMASEYFRLGNFEEAYQFSKMTVTESESYKSLTDLSWYCLFNNKFKEGYDHANKALMLNEKGNEAILMLLSANYLSGDASKNNDLISNLETCDRYKILFLADKKLKSLEGLNVNNAIVQRLSTYYNSLRSDTALFDINKFYIISTITVKEESLAETKTKELLDNGYCAGYLWTNDYYSLTKEKVYSVYLGPYKDIGTCERAVEDFIVENPNALGLEVSNANRRVLISGIGKVKVIEPFYK